MGAQAHEGKSKNGVKGTPRFSNKKLWLKFTILIVIERLLSSSITRKLTISLARKFSLCAFTFEGSI